MGVTAPRSPSGCRAHGAARLIGGTPLITSGRPAPADLLPCLLLGLGAALALGGSLGRPDVDEAGVRAAATAARLDEVTSALDRVNEAAVHEGIERLMAGRTVVTVAHRMRTVEGSHDELLRRSGRYAEFRNLSTARRWRANERLRPDGPSSP
ncbi:hypothetical protein ACFVW2_14550 [Streptomyces sp. NPDC058171]